MIQAIKKYQLLLIFITILSFGACQQPGGENPGSEFMPDMGHSIAYEANYYDYYSFNTWGTQEEYYQMAQPRLPVAGTVPRTSSSTISIAGVGSIPYAYGNTEEERTRATNELIDNPYKITDAGLASAKELYNINCGICHGEKGDGNGYLVRDGSAYPVQPAIFTSDEFVSASNGRYYHSIMHGKNLMGSYADKLSEEERWQVIHYIRSLQAKDRKLTYNQFENTLNSVDQPAGEIQVASMHHDDDSHDGDAHGHDGDHHDDGHHEEAHGHHGEKHEAHDDGHDHGTHDHDGKDHDIDHKGHDHDGHDHEGDDHDEHKHNH